MIGTRRTNSHKLSLYVNDGLIEGTGVHGLTRFWKPRRRKKVVKSLNPPHTGVRNRSSFKLPEPLKPELGSASNIRSRKFTLPKKLDGSVQERLCHKPSIGKVLPISQSVTELSTETLYREVSVIFSRMIQETTEDTLRTVAENTTAIMEKLGMSDAKVADKSSGISPKSVNNMANGRHSVGVDTMAVVAHKLGLEAWQLLVPGLPDDHPTQRALALLVKAFVSLGPKSQERILSSAENEAHGQGIFNDIFGPPRRRVAKAR